MQDTWGGESDEQGIRVSWNTGLYEWHTEVNHQFNAELIYHHPKSNLTFAVFLASSLFWFLQKKFAEESTDTKLDGQYMVKKKKAYFSLSFYKGDTRLKTAKILYRRWGGGCMFGI